MNRPTTEVCTSGHETATLGHWWEGLDRGEVYYIPAIGARSHSLCLRSTLLRPWAGQRSRRKKSGQHSTLNPCSSTRRQERRQSERRGRWASCRSPSETRASVAYFIPAQFQAPSVGGGASYPFSPPSQLSASSAARNTMSSVPSNCST
jgi:hypothetical protein